MKLFVILCKSANTLVRFGVNGGGEEGYCLFRGVTCCFKTYREAQAVVSGFDNPEDFEIRRFSAK